MNKLKFLLMLLVTLGLTLSTGCSDDESEQSDDILWDFIPHNILFNVEDKDGNDLLNPETEGNILENNIVVFYKDKEYKHEVPKGRAILTMPLAVRLFSGENYPSNLLAFGEFSPDGGYKGELLTIDWGDGTKDEIKFDLYITWKKKEPTVHYIIYLNGKKFSDELLKVKLVKEKRIVNTK